VTGLMNISLKTGGNALSVVLGITSPAVVERGSRDSCANHVCNLTDNTHLRLQN
jgi:hypothetical protein